MAISKQSIYDNAMTLLGQRRVLVTEDRPARYHLDSVWDMGAQRYCFELVKPVFARKTYHHTSSTTPTDSGFTNLYTLPTDNIAIVALYSDSKLDDKINRYITSYNTVACDHAEIWTRYVSTSFIDSFTNWSMAFALVVSAYLAKEVGIKIAPEAYDAVSKVFDSRVKEMLALNEELEPSVRSSQSTSTLTATWLNIYNDALLTMGLDELSSVSDDSNRRAKLDRVLNAGLVKTLLEDTSWLFAKVSTASAYDPSVQPLWGYMYAHQRPLDMLRLDGLFHDEYFTVPLTGYVDSLDYIFTSVPTFYISYISDSVISTPDVWPGYFTRLVAARLAHDASPSLVGEGANVLKATDEYDRRMSMAMSNNGVQSPNRRLSGGTWTGARRGGRSPWNR